MRWLNQFKNSLGFNLWIFLSPSMKEKGIREANSTPYYTQANDQVETTNKLLSKHDLFPPSLNFCFLKKSSCIGWILLKFSPIFCVGGDFFDPKWIISVAPKPFWNLALIFVPNSIHMFSNWISKQALCASNLTNLAILKEYSKSCFNNKKMKHSVNRRESWSLYQHYEKNRIWFAANFSLLLFLLERTKNNDQIHVSAPHWPIFVC